MLRRVVLADVSEVFTASIIRAIAQMMECEGVKWIHMSQERYQ
jgi:hypothetical protein